MDLYQVCSNYAPGGLKGLPRGHMFYMGLYRENMKRILLSETTRLKALVFGMQHHLVDLYKVDLNYAPGGHIFHRLIQGKHEKLLV